MYPVPSRPLKFVGIDLFDFIGEIYIVLADSYSVYLNSKNCKHPHQNIINFLQKQFSAHIVPSELISDNAPLTTHRKCSKNSVKNGTLLTSPNFPQSQVLIERAVCSAKDLLRKCEKDKQKFAILCNFSETHHKKP